MRALLYTSRALFTSSFVDYFPKRAIPPKRMIVDTRDEIDIFLNGLPKVELHVHLDGAFSSSRLLKELQATNNYECIPETFQLPGDKLYSPLRDLVRKCKDGDGLIRLCTTKKNSFTEFLKYFDIVVPIVRGNLMLLEMLAYEFVRRQAEQNIIYTEVRYSPHLLASGGSFDSCEKVDADPVVDVVTKGLRRGEKGFGVKVNQILCCLSMKPEWSNDIVRIASQRCKDKPCAVVGIDIAAGEDHFDNINRNTNLHVEAFKKAKELDLAITIHAGELGSASNIIYAVEKYGASRIGHGYNIDKSTMEKMKHLNIHFEGCPTSSVRTGAWKYTPLKLGEPDWSQHPCKKMIDYGLQVGFNSDDPEVFRTSLTRELKIAAIEMGLEKEFLIQQMINSLDFAFLSQEERIQLQQKVKKFQTEIIENSHL